MVLVLTPLVLRHAWSSEVIRLVSRHDYLKCVRRLPTMSQALRTKETYASERDARVTYMYRVGWSCEVIGCYFLLTFHRQGNRISGTGSALTIWMCRHTDRENAEQTFCPFHSLYVDTGQSVRDLNLSRQATGRVTISVSMARRMP